MDNKYFEEVATEDGFVTYDCGVGACPAIKREGDSFLVRNSINPGSVVRFNKSEMETLRAVLLDMTI